VNCEDNFSVLLYLQVHMLVHSGQKDFACPFCTYVTYVTHNLKKHCLSKHKVCVGSFHYSACNVHTTSKRSSITLNKNSTQAFQRAINKGSTPPLTSSKWG